jgi:hypothetical protein
MILWPDQAVLRHRPRPPEILQRRFTEQALRHSESKKQSRKSENVSYSDPTGKPARVFAARPGRVGLWNKIHGASVRPCALVFAPLLNNARNCMTFATILRRGHREQRDETAYAMHVAANHCITSLQGSCHLTSGWRELCVGCPVTSFIQLWGCEPVRGMRTDSKNVELAIPVAGRAGL